MALISQSDVEARLGRTLTAEEATAFTVINAALQSYVESLIGSSVEAAPVATRYYDGGVQNLSIDPCTNISSVKYVDEFENVEYTFTDDEYTLEPRNSTLKTWIRRRYKAFGRGFNNVAVAAKFSIYGDTDTLNVVKEAMIQYLASEVQDNSNIKKESIEGYSVEYATTESRAALSTIKYLFPEV